MIKHTLIFKFTDRGTFGVEIKVKIKIIQYVHICYITDFMPSIVASISFFFIDCHPVLMVKIDLI